MDEDERGPYILHSEMEKAVKEMKDNKAKSDDVLKLLGEDGLKIITPDENIHETGDCPKGFIEVK